MSKQKLGLGKGLGALIPEINEEKIPAEKGVVEIALNLVKPNPHQPRKNFNEEKLKELSDTIKEYGVLQPVILQKKEGYYYLVTGERRYRAALMAGLDKIPAILKEYSSRQSVEIALVENLQRENLNPIEEAISYKKLLEEFEYLQDDLAQKLGRSRSTIANTVRLLALEDEVQSYLADGSITAGQARPLLALSNGEEQKRIALKVIEEKLSARQVEKLVKGQINRQEKEALQGETSAEKQESQQQIKEYEEKMRDIYGTKVKIKAGRRKGKVEISFYGEEDLERLLTLLLK